MKKRNLYILGAISILATGFIVYKILQLKSSKKNDTSSNNNQSGNTIERNNWDDKGGYRILIAEGKWAYYDINGTYKGQGTDTGQWIPAA